MSVRKINRLKQGLRWLPSFCQRPARIRQNFFSLKWLGIQIFVHPFFCVYNLLFISSCIVLGGYFTCNCVHLIWCRSLRLNPNKFRDSTYLKRGPTTSSVIQVLRNLFSSSSVRLSKKFALHNKPFARWRHFTTTTGILFVFPLIFKFGSPNKV